MKNIVWIILLILFVYAVTKFFILKAIFNLLASSEMTPEEKDQFDREFDEEEDEDQEDGDF